MLLYIRIIIIMVSGSNTFTVMTTNSLIPQHAVTRFLTPTPPIPISPPIPTPPAPTLPVPEHELSLPYTTLPYTTLPYTTLPYITQSYITEHYLTPDAYTTEDKTRGKDYPSTGGELTTISLKMQTQEHDTKSNDTVGSNEPKSMLLNLIASCNSALAVLGLILNLIIVLYYKNKRTNLPSALYFRNGLCDMISAIGFLLQVPSVVSIMNKGTPVILPLLSYLITTVSVRMSVFMNCVLGVVRCINIINPFYLVNRKKVTLFTSVYLALWTAIATFDVWFYSTKVGLKNKVYLIKSVILKAEPGFSITSLTGSKGAALTSLSQGEIVLVQFLTPIAIPALLCFVLMIVQIAHLNKRLVGRSEQNPAATDKDVSGKIKSKRRGRQSNNQKAATTILIVTTIFVLTSTVSVAAWLVVYRDHLGGGDKMKKLSWVELSIIYFSTSTLPLLCSTLTPLTLLIRSNVMQLYLRNASRKQPSIISCSRTQTVELQGISSCKD